MDPWQLQLVTSNPLYKNAHTRQAPTAQSAPPRPVTPVLALVIMVPSTYPSQPNTESAIQVSTHQMDHLWFAVFSIQNHGCCSLSLSFRDRVLSDLNGSCFPVLVPATDIFYISDSGEPKLELSYATIQKNIELARKVRELEKRLQEPDANPKSEQNRAQHSIPESLEVGHLSFLSYLL